MHGALDGDGVDVGEVANFSAQLRRGYAQNAAAAADVQNDVARLQIILHELHAEGSRLVLARAERHVGIEQDNLFARLLFILYPLGYDDDLPQMNGTEVLAPNIYPVVPLDLALRSLESAEVDLPRRPL